ncbi:MAG: valine--tRNA ligase [bacterium]
MDCEIPKRYAPGQVESKWYKFWMEKGYFRAEAGSERKPYCIVIPPPNITGSLHVGHALNNGLQDILIRFNKMRGMETLWLPGMDHAGIATQNVVERELRKENLTRFDLGREEFIKRVWGWKEKYQSRIREQLMNLGFACDWRRERFTLDEGLSAAVREAFVRYYEKGLIYKGKRIINWCPRCASAISDLEVRHRDIPSKLWYLKYPLKDSSTFVAVATTRPETMLGDTAVAVSPRDGRYKALVGKMVSLPLTGREIPVITDDLVDPDFGTGAVKVTPGHDPNDFDIGQRHKLAVVNVIGQDGRMTPDAGEEYRGLTREECRGKVVSDMEALGLLEKIEDYHHAVGECDRCKTTIEPLISEQWFVRMEALAGPAIDAVKSGRVKFIPERWTKVYLNWMENIKDWCISRQLWWGHRIPVWYCDECSGLTVSRSTPERCCSCGGGRIRQDEDVLDTWFSSALWPFSTLGWPEETGELDFFYPTNVLVTDPDIIYLWVARMIVSGLEFMKEIPFPHVYIHSTVLTRDGKRMSRSLGTGVDPVEMMEKYGTDSLRFTLTFLETQSQSFRLWEERCEMGRNFCNKLWNASRFILMKLDPEFTPLDIPVDAQLDLPDRWILSRLNRVAGTVTSCIEKYSFHEAASAVYDFFWHEYCDWYLELIKPRLSGRDKRLPLSIAVHCLDWSVRMLHPIMPFITEEIWQRLPHEGESIMTSGWTEKNDFLLDSAAEGEFAFLMGAIVAVRNIRSEMNLPPGKAVECIISCAERSQIELIESLGDYIKRLANVSELDIGTGLKKPGASASAVIAPGVRVYIPLGEMIDVAVEKKRLSTEIGKIENELKKIEMQLADSSFASKAPPDVVEAARRKRDGWSDKVRMLKETLASIEED